jgi:hypothetical protein
LKFVLTASDFLFYFDTQQIETFDDTALGIEEKFLRESSSNTLSGAEPSVFMERSIYFPLGRALRQLPSELVVPGAYQLSAIERPFSNSDPARKAWRVREGWGLR